MFFVVRLSFGGVLLLYFCLDFIFILILLLFFFLLWFVSWVLVGGGIFILVCDVEFN